MPGRDNQGQSPTSIECGNGLPHRKIRSFVLREGRMTPGQKRAMQSLWPRFGLDYCSGLVDFAEIFGRQAPTFIEIGFGDGEALLDYAQRNTHNNYIGIEVHRPGVGHALQQIEERGLENVKVCAHDGVEVLTNMVPKASLAGVHIFFPDPWHKKKHNKRRIFQAPFLAQLVDLLIPGGVVHFATDWQDYAEFALAELEKIPTLQNIADNKGYADRGQRPVTKFERRGQRLGHGVWDIVATKV